MQPALSVRALLVVVAVLLAIIAAMGAAILAHVGGQRLPNALATGGACFCAALPLVILVFSSAGAL
ncbi:hypothetical protein ACIA8C_26890 [Nocardia sp. NPDC051321]|uniref:hypothetical protein n=1 Tax=Nocardia sp. NPDC051321 TaxID=3364323 RepID=UPI003788ED21